MKLSFLLRSAPLALVLLAAARVPSHAGSATWIASPTSGDWNTAANWTPTGFPNDPTAVATFDVSDTTDISLSGPIQVGEIVFNPGSSAFAITKQVPSLRIYGAGISNQSGIVQNFVTGDADSGGGSKIALYNSATIGPQTNMTVYGGFENVGNGMEGGLLFYNNSSAGDATILVDDPFYYNYFGSLIEFNDQSTAGNSHITLRGEVAFAASNAYFWDSSTAGSATITMEGDHPCVIQFRDNSSAGYANITIKGGPDYLSTGVVYFYGATADHATILVEGETGPSGGGVLYLNAAAADATVIVQGGNGGGLNGGLAYLNTTSGDATITINGGSNGGLGGYCNMDVASGAARMEIFGDGLLEGTAYVGSIEGDGLITGDLTVGANNLSTTFSGVISGSTLSKIGTGNLTLTGANTYTARTTVSDGILSVSNKAGSGTGTGPVFVQGGILAGHGIIAGAVAIGNASGPTATLDPAGGMTTYPTLTLQDNLTFNSTSIYNYGFKAKRSNTKAAKVIANGVTINSGATFTVTGRTQGTLNQGLVLTAIKNTATTPISGAFSNLADGAIVTVNGNNFQANYEGGDGNDLTLTVVP